MQIGAQVKLGFLTKLVASCVDLDPVMVEHLFNRSPGACVLIQGKLDEFLCFIRHICKKVVVWLVVFNGIEHALLSRVR